MTEGSGDITQRIVRVEGIQAAHAVRLDKVESKLQQVDADIYEVRAKLEQVATKTDVVALKSHAEQLINGVLRDALNAVPAKHMVMLTTILVIATLVGTFWAFHVGAR